MNLLRDQRLDLQLLEEFSQKPALYAPGESHFWDDPYISQQMLEAHLNPAHDAASRKPETIDCTVKWLVDEFLATLPGRQVMDLGCGPGLYTVRLAKAGYQVSGIDLSESSIRYAQSMAKKEGLHIAYKHADYLKWRAHEQFDAVQLIYFDFGTFGPPFRRIILENIQRALKPGGLFIFDIATEQHIRNLGSGEEWHAATGGFWSPDPYLCLSRNFCYDDKQVMLSQHVVIDSSGETKVYRIWEHWFTSQSIKEELYENGFEIVWIGNDLCGNPYQTQGNGMGVIARKM
ncbi:MAG: SAM-dependent methyltransferase [Chloroflexi bacterium HGW-Chloroflexi-10]|nr:MAG: SAM-dependent methyltransferase [Chloroflexi bacterium HGW-Chloroflexi-10]